MGDGSAVVDLGIDGIAEAVQIGQGGFGTVYRAVQPAYRRTVAVKVLAMTYADDHSRSAFDKECQALGSLSSHPNIVTLHQAGMTAYNRPYLIMEYLAGGSMAARVASGPVPWPDAIGIGVKLAGALAAAHAAGVLHRDVKPDNVLFSEYGEPQLADFGVARLFEATRTVTGAFSGSITHAAPETLSGVSATEASDVWSLASTIATMIAGSPPFGSPTQLSMQALITRILTADPVDLRSLGTPEPVCVAIETGLAKDSWERPGSAEAFGILLQDAERRLGVPVTPMTLRNPVAPVTIASPITDHVPRPIPAHASGEVVETVSRAQSETVLPRRPAPPEDPRAGADAREPIAPPGAISAAALSDGVPAVTAPVTEGPPAPLPPTSPKDIPPPPGPPHDRSRAGRRPSPVRRSPKLKLAMGGSIIAAIAIVAAVALAAGGKSSRTPSHAAGRAAATTPPSTSTAPSTTTGPPTTTASATSVSPAASTAGLDDYDGDGAPDPTCATQDFGAGLVLRIPCQITNPHDPDSGTVLVKGSLYRLPGGIPGYDLPELDNVSAEGIFARDAAGNKVLVVIINSDALFDVGSSTLTAAADRTLGGIISLIKDHFPNAAIQVRGHTDATGAADANQMLSEARAAAARSFLTSNGLNSSSVTSVGLGSSEPLVDERNPDGSDNPTGRQTNRRVEIVIRAGPGPWPP